MGVRFFVKKTPEGPITLMQVYDCTEHAVEFSDISNGGGSTSCSPDKYGEPSSNVTVTSGGPDEGGNLISVDKFPTDSKITIDYYWETEASNWYNDALNNAMNYLFIVKADDWTVNTANWAYGRVDSPAWMRINMRAPSLNLTLQGQDALSVTSSIDIIADSWNPFTIEIDWPNETIKIWVLGVLEIEETIPATTIATIGDEFQIGYHWHSYTDTETQGYSRIKLENGNRIDVVDIPSVRTMEVSEWGTQDSEGYVSGGVLNLDAITGDANQYVTREWIYKLRGEFDFYMPYNTTHNDQDRYVGIMVAPSDDPIANPQNFFSLDRSWGINGDSWRTRYSLDGSVTLTTQALSPDTAYQSGWLRFRRINNNFQIYYGPQIKYCFQLSQQKLNLEVTDWADKDFVIRPYIFKQDTFGTITANYNQITIVRGNVVN